MAAFLGLSSRTLMRRLQEEGITFQKLRDNVLKQQSLDYLKNNNMSVEATAIALGFSDTSSFRRTFKRWFGQKPSAHIGSTAD